MTQYLLKIHYLFRFPMISLVWIWVVTEKMDLSNDKIILQLKKTEALSKRHETDWRLLVYAGCGWVGGCGCGWRQKHHPHSHPHPPTLWDLDLNIKSNSPSSGFILGHIFFTRVKQKKTQKTIPTFDKNRIRISHPGLGIGEESARTRHWNRLRNLAAGTHWKSIGSGRFLSYVFDLGIKNIHSSKEQYIH
jgi:hypothetical protein